MATQVFFRSAAPPIQLGTNNTNLRGTAQGWTVRSLSTTRGSGGENGTSSTVTGPTNGIEVGSGLMEFLSPPVDADTTISGTITFNLRSLESNMSANVAINCIIERLDSTGAIVSTISQTARVTELGTTEAAANFTATPTSTNMLKGDRLRIRVYGDDAGTMATGYTFTLVFDGGTAGASGDSYVTFTETFGFQTTTPTGSTLYLTDVAGPVVGADIEKEMWTSRGDGVNSLIRNTATGWTAPLQWTDSAGGTNVEWYSKALQAFTLSGLILCNIRALESNAAATAGLRCEIAVVNGDGSGAVVWAAADVMDGTSNNGEIGTVETAYPLLIGGDDLAVTDGQRLRLRVYVDDIAGNPLVTGYTCTMFYDGTSGGASGDSFITLSQSITESVAAPPRNPAMNLTTGGVM